MERTILITGASSGIGRAAAFRFWKGGWNVAASARDPARTADLPEDARLLRPCLDVTDEPSVASAVRQVLDRYGRLDAVVNNAGYGLNGPLEGVSTEQLRRQFDTNVLGLAAVCRAVLPAMRAQKSGVIVNVSSIGGRIGFPYGSPYHATKFAVEGLSESLRFELKAHGVRVKLVEPGGVRTDFLGRSLEWASHPAYEPAASRFREFTASLDDALPGPEPVAEVIWRAATDGSDRLRYPAKPGPYLLVRRLAPDAVWRSMVMRLLHRHARMARRFGPAQAAA